VSKGLTSHLRQYRSFPGSLQARWSNQQCQSTEGSQSVTEIRLVSNWTQKKKGMLMMMTKYYYYSPTVHNENNLVQLKHGMAAAAISLDSQTAELRLWLCTNTWELRRDRTAVLPLATSHCIQLQHTTLYQCNRSWCEIWLSISWKYFVTHKLWLVYFTRVYEKVIHSHNIHKSSAAKLMDTQYGLAKMQAISQHWKVNGK